MISYYTLPFGRDSSVSIATASGWTVWGSNSGGGGVFRTRPDRPWGSPSPLSNGYRVFIGGISGRGVALSTHPHLVPRVRKSRAILLLPSGLSWSVLD